MLSHLHTHETHIMNGLQGYKMRIQICVLICGSLLPVDSSHALEGDVHVFMHVMQPQFDQVSPKGPYSS